MDINLTTVGAVPIVIALTQIFKQFINERFYPLLSLAFGLAIGGAIKIAEGADLLTATLVGIITGLTASGLYDQKALIK